VLDKLLWNAFLFKLACKFVALIHKTACFFLGAFEFFLQRLDLIAEKRKMLTKDDGASVLGN